MPQPLEGNPVCLGRPRVRNDEFGPGLRTLANTQPLHRHFVVDVRANQENGTGTLGLSEGRVEGVQAKWCKRICHCRLCTDPEVDVRGLQNFSSKPREGVCILIGQVTPTDHTDGCATMLLLDRLEAHRSTPMRLGPTGRAQFTAVTCNPGPRKPVWR